MFILFTKNFKYILFLSLILISIQSYSQENIFGHWEGNININGSEIGIKTNFNNDIDSLRGTMDIPVQNAHDLKLIHCRLKDSKIHFELPSKLGTASFDGIMSGDSMTGKFLQAEIEGTFRLNQGEAKPETKITEDVPYNREEITFINGENTFAGTLTIPHLKGKHPAVVMVTGSGPHDRNEEILGFKIFKIIADHLTRNGIAVLRYDDRGVGGTTGKSKDESTTDDFSGDVIEAVKYLKTRDDINPDQIGLCGHSEGGIVAPLAASKYNGIAFIVLIAGTGVKGIDILKEQSSLIMKADKVPDEEIQGYNKLLDEAYEVSKKNSGWKEFKDEIRDAMKYNYDHMPDDQKSKIKNKDEYVNTMTDLTVNQYKSTWMKYFMDYDPSIALSKVTCPVLMFFGEKDMQVPVKQNQKPMEDALKKGGNKDYTVKVMPDANHLFQSAITGSPNEYASLPKEFVPGFLDTMSDWIIQRVTVVK